MLTFRKYLTKKRLAITLFLLTFLTLLPLHSARASVGLLYFHAIPGSNFIKLEWETAQEFNNFGFNLYRGLTEDFDDAEQLNTYIIPADGGATGAYYEWTDNNVQIDTPYTYWLEDIDNDGNSTVHDPVTASTIGGNTFPTVPSPGGGNSTATPTPTRTPTRTPTPTGQSGSAATPTRTPTRIPTTQPTTSSNPAATTAPQVQPTAVSNNPTTQQPTAISQSVTTTPSEPEREETTETNNSVPTSVVTTTISTDPEATATPQSLVQAESASDQGQDDETDSPTAQQIGQGGQESQETGTTNSNNSADDSNRSTLVVMALIISVVLLLAGGGGIIVLLLNRTKQTRV